MIRATVLINIHFTQNKKNTHQLWGSLQGEYKIHYIKIFEKPNWRRSSTRRVQWQGTAWFRAILLFCAAIRHSMQMDFSNWVLFIFDDIRRFLRDHNSGPVNVPRRDSRHYRRIHNSQLLQPFHSEILMIRKFVNNIVGRCRSLLHWI